MLLSLTLMGCTSAYAEVITFDNPWGQQGFTLVSQGSNGVEVIFSQKSFALEDLDVNGETMKTIQIPGVILPNNAGAPNLPGVGRMVALPEGATPSLKILEIETETYHNVNMSPAPPIPYENDDSPLVYEKDPSIYSRNVYYPESAVMVSEVGQLRGVDVVTIGITPFQYNPVTKELLVYKNLRIAVDFQGGAGYFGEDRLRSRHWEPVLQGNLLNYSSLPDVDLNKAGLSTGRTEDYEYIIIIPDDPDFEAWADSLKQWRTKQGIRTGIVPLSEIGGNNASLIEDYVDNAYNNWDIPPEAVLLLSDYQSSGKGRGYGITAPVYNYGYSCVSDNFYADVDNDDLPDIAFARITAQNNTHLTNMIGKMLEYERNPPTDPDVYNLPVIAGGWQTTRWFILCTEVCLGFMQNELGMQPTREYAIYSGTPGSEWSSNQNTYMIVDYFGPDGLGYIPLTPEHLNDWGGNATRVNADINAGTFMVLHRDHGGVDGWGEPDYDTGDLNNLTNDVYPFVFSINCLTGKYNSGSECFTEKFHRIEHGALGLLAASEVSYSFVNDTYIWGMYDGMWPEFMPAYPESDIIGSENLRPCWANVNGKYFLHQSNWPYNPQNKDETYYLFHHHGDAFITMYSQVPQPLTVSHANILFSGFDYFVVTADEGALIGLSVDGEVIGVAEGAGGPVQVPVTPQLPGVTMTVTVTKANYYRYEQTVDVIPPEGYGVIEGYVTDLVTGDGLQGYVTVTNRDPQIIGYCEPDGFYTMYVPADTLWDLRAEHTNEYLPSFAQASVAEDDTTVQDFQLEPKVEVIIRASFGNAADIAYRTFYFRGSWNDDGFWDPEWQSSFSPMRDDGIAPDQIEGDGIFTGSILLATDPDHTYDWAVYAENYNDEASRLQDGEGFIIENPGSPPTVPVLSVNPTGNEHDWTLTVEDISGAEVDMAPGYNGNPETWYVTVNLPGNYTSRFRIKAMRTDDVYYGVGGIGGERIVFTPPEAGEYTFYFRDSDDVAGVGIKPSAYPDWLEADVEQSAYQERVFTLTNEGEVELSYEINPSSSWITLDPSAGTIAAGAYDSITVRLSSGSMPVGDYYGSFTISSYDEYQELPDVDVPVTMHVISDYTNLEVASQPDESPVVVPPGGRFDFGIFVTNHTGWTMYFDGWLMVTLPDNTLVGPLARVDNIGLAPFGTMYTEAPQPIPNYADAGDHTFHVRVGNCPSTVVDEVTFPFQVTGDALSGGYTSWVIDEFNFDIAMMRGGSGDLLPTEYSLSQNYPNPFNAKSTINFTLPIDGVVDLTIYNLLGQRVETLVSGPQEAGYHSVTWDASYQASGVYFYKLTCGDKIFTKRMTLLK